MFLLRPDIFPWDLAILLLIALGICLWHLCMRWLHAGKGSSFTRLAAGTFGTVMLLGAAITAYGSFMEPHLYVTTRHSITLPLQKPIRIALISDLHVGPYKGRQDVQRIVDRVNRELPDLVLIAGDFVATPESDATDLAPLSHLRASLGVYAVLGNHDVGLYQTLLGRRTVEKDSTQAVRTALKNYGVTLLENQRKTIQLPEGTVVIAGIDDPWSQSSDIRRALDGIPPDAAVILLVHNPEIIIDPASHRAHLIAAGHTHGGQFRLPFFGPIAPIPTKLGQTYDEGLFTVDSDTTLAITRGAGETLARARLFAWPEVMVLQTR